MAEAVRRCQVCQHPSVLGINQAILNGKSYLSLARDYKIGSTASGDFKPDHKKVTRHAEGCLKTSYQQVTDQNLSQQGQALTARMKFLDEQVETAIKDALEGEVLMVGDTPMLEDDGSPKRVRTWRDTRTLLAAVREGRQNVVVVAKLAGAMPDDDMDALEQVREGLLDPEVRRLTQELEERLAANQAANGGDRVDT